MKLSALICAAMLLMPAVQAADTLDMYVLDTEGGKAEIIRTPSGQAVLIDAGFPSANRRDLQRILAVAKEIGITSFDYLIVSHFDVDHVGNVPALAAEIPVKTFVDHGTLSPDPKMNPVNTRAAEAYFAFVQGKKRIIVKRGDKIPLRDVDVTVLTSNGKAIGVPPKGAGAGAGKPNPACPAEPREELMNDDNSGSVGELWKFGNFRMADFGDLLKWVENRLVCPTNNVGKVDLFMVNHHGVNLSNSPELVAALAPKAAIMNNGARKGNAVDTVTTLRNAVSKPDVWQVHFSIGIPAELNPPEDFIANLSAANDEAKMIKVSASKDGSFTITNTRNGFTKTYK
ncbi:MAG: MBL fold metallo-hydrolase [Bryobacteraceae bacterium]